MTKIRYMNFWLFLTAMIAVTAGLGATLGIWRAFLIGFDLGAVIFIIGTLHMMRESDPEGMRQRAKRNDPDHYALMLVAFLIMFVVLVAVTVELTGAGHGKGSAVAVAGMTLLLVWLFSNLLFALHYTHIFYSPGDKDDEPSRGSGEDKDTGGLEFPGDELPGYGDFAYFSFVLGMTFQVSDVQITAKPIRRLALYHSLAAFGFNIVVVALSVSLIGNLLQSK
ncbi:MAG: DUF1345 domain-containing protein [Janthinobacterium lividum]